MNRQQAFRISMACLALAITPARAKDATSARVTHLRTDLLGPNSATQVLTQWCGDLGLAATPVIKAVVVKGADKKPDADARALLMAGDGAPVRYRRVRLMCGTHVLSEADNWYLPGKLTAAMNRTLDTTDTSFGTVVRPLDFHRKTLAIGPARDASSVLQVRALLIDGAGAPFSLVVENYSRELATAPQPRP